MTASTNDAENEVIAAANAAMTAAFARVPPDYWRKRDAFRFRFDNLRQLMARSRRNVSAESPAARAAAIERQLASDTHAALYVGLPWCVQTCDFCDLAFGRNPTRAQEEEYLADVGREMDIYLGLGLKDKSISSLYFGGGTPTILGTELLERYICRSLEKVKVSATTLVTCEASPATVTKAKLERLRSMVSRISLGVQTLDTELRRKNGRILAREEVLERLRLVRDYFETVNVDIIYGLEGQTPQSFYRTLADLVELEIPSITLYRMELIEGTPAHAKARVSPWEGIEERTARLFYFIGKQVLESAGYQEQPLGWFVRRAATRPRQSWDDMLRHWSRVVPYLGVGLGAFSTGPVYWMESASNEAQWRESIAHGRVPSVWRAELNDSDRFMLRFMRLVRSAPSVQRALFDREPGVPPGVFNAFLDKQVETGLMKSDDERVELTAGGQALVHWIIAEAGAALARAHDEERLRPAALRALAL